MEAARARQRSHVKKATEGPGRPKLWESGSHVKETMQSRRKQKECEREQSRHRLPRGQTGQRKAGQRDSALGVLQFPIAFSYPYLKAK